MARIRKEGANSIYSEREDERVRIGLPSKRKIAEDLGLDPNSLTRTEFKRVESKYRVQHGISVNAE